MSISRKGKCSGESNGFYGKHHTEETKKRVSVFMKKVHAGKNNPFYGKTHTLEKRLQWSLHRRGKNNGNWNGGTARLPYPVEFNDELREFVRNRFGRICMICFKKENGKRLNVHHIDYDKNNNKFDNLIPLHEECHTKTNPVGKSRKYWKNIFSEEIFMLTN